jgi:hypothetical protein
MHTRRAGDGDAQAAAAAARRGARGWARILPMVMRILLYPWPALIYSLSMIV